MTRKNNRNHFTWAKAFRDIVVTAINKGQLLGLGLMTIVIIILIRLPERQLYDIVRLIIEHLVKGELLAYILLCFVCVGWFFQARIARKNHTEEMNRTVEEKSKLQNLLAKKQFKSSES